MRAIAKPVTWRVGKKFREVVWVSVLIVVPRFNQPAKQAAY